MELTGDRCVCHAVKIKCEVLGADTRRVNGAGEGAPNSVLMGEGSSAEPEESSCAPWTAKLKDEWARHVRMGADDWLMELGTGDGQEA